MTTKTRYPILTLITDFGLQDEYVGVVKGVILSHAPDARIVDISHLIPPQSISTAAHLLGRSAGYFPPDTVHLVIVDPGVGSNRAILAIAADSQYFVGPDNGVFTPILDRAATLAVYRVDTTSHFLNDMSSTFHGRDIMAPIAGQLAAGRDITLLGSGIDPSQCHRLLRPSCNRMGDTLQGEIVHVDGFGNLSTNIHRQDIESFAAGREIRVHVTDELVLPLGRTYSSQTIGAALALFDSHDFLEIAVNQGNASHHLQLTIGTKISIKRPGQENSARPNGLSNLTF